MVGRVVILSIGGSKMLVAIMTILLIGADGVHTHTQEYNSMKTCEQAVVVIKKNIDKSYNSIYISCTEK